MASMLQKPDVQLEDDRIDFSAVGIGMRGRNRYSFSIEFYYEVNSAVSISEDRTCRC